MKTNPQMNHSKNLKWSRKQFKNSFSFKPSEHSVCSAWIRFPCSKTLCQSAHLLGGGLGNEGIGMMATEHKNNIIKNPKDHDV